MMGTFLKKPAALLLAIFMCAALAAPSALAAGDVPGAAGTAGASAVSDEQEKVAEFKAEVVRLVNLERQKAGVSALKTMDALAAMADTRAQESSVVFKHTRPDGRRCFTIFADNGMKYRAAGENLAYGFKTPADVVEAWMNSESHRRNILDPDFKYIGIGYFVAENGKIYCSQLFYTPKSGG